jgi:hypothetical protein
MIKSRTCILLMALIVVVPCLGARSPADLTPDQYRAELDHLLVATDQLDQPGAQIPELINSLPSVWRAVTDRGTFEVSTEWLRDDLAELEHKYDQALVNKIRERLAHQRADLDAYQKSPNDISRQRAMMAGILSRPEFQDLHGPTWIDRLKQRFVQFLIRLFGRAITSSIFSNVGKIFVYGLMVVAFLALAYWVYRSIQTTAKVETILPESLPVSAREWRVWLADAREAAQRGSWRDAIHLAYWAGISFLESQGVWRPDSARTPREYLRLMPTANEHRPVLAALTRKFELVWYAAHPADAQAFSQTLEELEKLGCR